VLGIPITARAPSDKRTSISPRSSAYAALHAASTAWRSTWQSCGSSQAAICHASCACLVSSSKTRHDRAYGAILRGVRLIAGQERAVGLTHATLHGILQRDGQRVANRRRRDLHGFELGAKAQRERAHRLCVVDLFACGATCERDQLKRGAQACQVARELLEREHGGCFEAAPDGRDAYCSGWALKKSQMAAVAARM
jgi:hypothetical protein